MDIDLAKTFLAVVETGSFIDAAERVHVTQSTVSMRIRNLEEQLGRVLFEWSKAGASLTAAGKQFHRHALTLVRVWEQARLEVSLPPSYEAALTVGGQFSPWASSCLTGCPECAVTHHRLPYARSSDSPEHCQTK